MSGTYVQRLNDPASVRYLRFIATADQRLHRVCRSISQRTGDGAATGFYRNGNVRLSDPAGTFFKRLVEERQGRESVLQGVQVSISANFAQAGKTVLADSHNVIAENYYEISFEPISKTADDLGRTLNQPEEIGQRRIFTRISDNKFRGKVQAGILLELRNELDSFPPVMWDYLDRHLLPLMPKKLTGKACYYAGKGPIGPVTADDVLPFHGPLSAREASAHLTNFYEPKAELATRLGPTREMIINLLATNS